MANGKLGSAALTANTNTLIYTVPAGKTAMANIRFANTTGAGARIRVAIGSGASPNQTDYTAYDITIPANGVYEDTGFICGAGENVWAYSDAVGIVVRVHGIEE